MLKAFLIVILITTALSVPESQKSIAVADQIPLDLKSGEVKQLTHSPQQHHDLAFMLNADIDSDPTQFPELQIIMENADKDKANCHFKYPGNICVLEKSTPQVNIKIKCQSLICKTDLTLSQRVLYSFEGSDSHKSKVLTVPGQIYKIEKQKFNTILEIYSELKEESIKNHEISVYSNVHAFQLKQIQELDANSVVFGLKPALKDNQEYFYVEGDKSDKNKQLRINVKTHTGMLKEGVAVVDFIQTYGHKSISRYDYDGIFSKNIQVYARIFAPRDPNDIPFAILVSGKNDHASNATLISSLHLSSLNFNGQKFIDISFVVSKSLHQAFKIISFSLQIQKVQNKTIFIQFEADDVATAEVAIIEEVYFSCNKGEEIHFAVSPQIKYEVVGEDKEITVATNASQHYLSNTLTCSLHKGCSIDVKTTQACTACSFKFDLKGTDIRNNIIYYKVKDNEIQAKVDINEELFFRRDTQAKKAVQVVVNTPNVMVYVNFEGYQRCKIPTAACHQFVINQQNPKIIINTAQKAQDMILGVVGLEKSNFKVKFLQSTKGLSLELGEKFSYLFDNEEEEITVLFQTDDQTFTQKDTHLSFNLISPINSLQLTVSNQDGLTLAANDGYVEFPKKDIGSSNFTIKINKIGMFVNQFVHMTLIVSTADTAIRLDSTSTHYEKFLRMAEKKFIMEYDPTQQNMLNIYTQNLEKTMCKMILNITDINLESAQKQKKPFISKILERDNEAINLDLSLENLDICEDINCELEITIRNECAQELEQAITILHEESVVMLDDSIWNSFDINQLSTSNHFYYIPRQPNKPINILFNTENKNIFIDYQIHNTKKSINPQDWPWGHHSKADKKDITKHLTGFQQFKIPADSSQLKECWPNCVILITVGDAHLYLSEQSSRQLIKTYKILVSSTVTELPEDTRFQVMMQTDEENAMFIELRNFLKSETQEFTFFTQYKVGRAIIKASLIAKGQEFKINNDKDFLFESIETHMPISLVKNVLDKHHLKAEETMLKINFKALTPAKLYFEFTSYMKNFYRLNMDDLEIVTLREGEEIWYEFIPERDFSIKFYRAKGFPLFKIIECSEESYIDCLSKHKKLLAYQVEQKKQLEEKTKAQKSSQNKSKAIEISQQLQQSTKKELQLFVDKNYEYSRQQCDKCIIFIWVYCYAQDLQLSINIRSSNTELELKEMAVVNDRITQFNKYNKYLVNIEPDKTTIVTFRIIEGEAQVEIMDSSDMLVNQTFSSIEKDYKDINIDALSLPEATKKEEETQTDSNDIPNIPPVFKTPSKHKNKPSLRHIHVKVISKSEKPIEYLLSYSIGYSGVFLEDGVVSQKKMVPDVSHVFYYHNQHKTSHAYLTLSSTAQPGYEIQYSKNQYEVRFFYYPDANRRDIKQEFKPEMPPKKNQNFLGTTITHVYELPTRFELFEIELYTKNYIKITASINHQELIYLPLGFQYLIKLHANESIFLVVDRPPSDFLSLSIKKCDTSVPSIFYTNDAKQFQEGLYESGEEIQNSYEKKLIQTKKGSKTIHIKLVAQETVDSIFTVAVEAEFDQKTSNSHKIKPGNNGLISFTTMDTNKVEVEFSPLTCDGKECPSTPEYFLLITQSLDNVYGELNCAGSFLISPSDKMNHRGQVVEVTHKSYNPQLKIYRVGIELKNDQSFIGVKAVTISNNKRVEVMYAPTQIGTLWKQISKLSVGIFLVVSVFLAVIIAVVVVVSTKLARRGYRPIASDE